MPGPYSAEHSPNAPGLILGLSESQGRIERPDNRMSNTRRSLLQSAAALAAGLSGAAASAQTPGRGGAGGAGLAGAPPQPAASPKPASEVHIPKVRFGGVEISRLVCGVNPFYGYCHFNDTLSGIMREYYTPERVCEVLHQCNRFGIDAFNYLHQGRGPADLERFQAEGGKMHLIVQCLTDPAEVCKAVKPLAIYQQGEVTDRAFRAGQMDTIRDFCKRVRDAGALAGVGTHKPEVIALVEDQGWDVDFYAGCVYNRTRTQEEWRKALNGELPEMPGEIYIQSDPPKMYAVMRQTRKPCFAFKILAAGRVTNVEQAFKTAFASIKPGDGVFIGLFPRVKDEVRDDAERAARILARS